MDDPKDYKVGYGRPPIQSRFTKGRSGNPKGRRKGTKNIATILHEIMHELINVKDNGRERAMTKIEAMMRQIASKALSGELNAAKEILHWNQVFQEAAERKPVDGPDLARDEEVVRSLLKRMREDSELTEGSASGEPSTEKDKEPSDDEL